MRSVNILAVVIMSGMRTTIIGWKCIAKTKGGSYQCNLLLTCKARLWQTLGLEGEGWDKFISFKDEEKVWEEG